MKYVLHIFMPAHLDFGGICCITVWGSRLILELNGMISIPFVHSHPGLTTISNSILSVLNEFYLFQFSRQDK